MSPVPSLTLSQQYVADGGVDVVVHGVSAVDHQAVHELHGFGSLTPQFSRNHHLTTLGPALHDEAQHTIAGPENHKHDSDTWTRNQMNKHATSDAPILIFQLIKKLCFLCLHLFLQVNKTGWFQHQYLLLIFLKADCGKKWTP